MTRLPQRPTLRASALLGLLLFLGGCASTGGGAPAPVIGVTGGPEDPRIGLRPGLMDAGEAIWNLRKLSSTPPAPPFAGATHSDLAFTGSYAIQGTYRGVAIWDLSTPSAPSLVTALVCPASQSDVSVYRNLLFVSGEGMEGRTDCGTQGVPQAVSPLRLRGIRIFDISDIREPRYVGNVQTCRGSHTHTVVEDPNDPANVYIYVSGSAPVRPAEELAGCSEGHPAEDPGTALFRIEVIRVPLDRPEEAAIVTSPRIFEGLTAPPMHGPTPEELEEIEALRATGATVVELLGLGEFIVVPDQIVDQIYQLYLQSQGRSGVPTAADSVAVNAQLPSIITPMVLGPGFDASSGPTQCHDITVYMAIRRGGGACEGYGLLLDLTDPANPRRIDAAADENFAYWHSATFNQDGTAILFTDEWGGGSSARCRASDPREWGANAIFSIVDDRLVFRSYYKLPVPQTEMENCVAHNGSLIPVPGRDLMIQSWYQGGISLFDWTDPSNPFEIAFHDRGPVHAERLESGGSWSVYWYNGLIVSSEIARGLDVFELVPSEYLTQNEIDAARSVRLEEFNPQAQPRYVWEPSFSVARAYLDQLERSRGLSAGRVATVRNALVQAEGSAGAARTSALNALAGELEREAANSSDSSRVRRLAETLRGMAAGD